MNSYLDDADTLTLLSGEEIRYFRKEREWLEEGYPLKCPICGAIASDIYFLEDTETPALFYCRNYLRGWDGYVPCRTFWICGDVPSSRIDQVKSELGIA